MQCETRLDGRQVAMNRTSARRQVFGWWAACGWAAGKRQPLWGWLSLRVRSSSLPLPHAALEDSLCCLHWPEPPRPEACFIRYPTQVEDSAPMVSGVCAAARPQRNKLRSAGLDVMSQIESWSPKRSCDVVLLPFLGERHVDFVPNIERCRVSEGFQPLSTASIDCRCHRTVWRADIIDHGPFRRSVH